MKFGPNLKGKKGMVGKEERNLEGN